MLQTVHRARLRDRRGAIAEPWRARLADRVATLVELRRQRPDPRRLYLCRMVSSAGSSCAVKLVDCICSSNLRWHAVRNGEPTAARKSSCV